jgi:hypothetical protein
MLIDTGAHAQVPCKEVSRPRAQAHVLVFGRSGFRELQRGSQLRMRFAFFGLVLAAIIFLASGGHLLFLPLFFVLPLGGLFGHRRRYGRF